MEWFHNWGQMSDADLMQAARYYLWVAEAFPDLDKQRLGEVMAEVERREKPEILRQARFLLSSQGAPRSVE